MFRAQGKDTDELQVFCNLKRTLGEGYLENSCRGGCQKIKLNDRLFYTWSTKWVKKEKREHLWMDGCLKELNKETREVLEEAEDLIGPGRFIWSNEGETVTYKAPYRRGRIILRRVIHDSGIQAPDLPWLGTGS